MSQSERDGTEVTFARRVLLFSLVVIGLGHTVLFAVLAPLGREVGLTEIEVGAIISASSITVFLTVPIWGRVSDRWGRKRVMLVGMFGYTIGTVLFAAMFKVALVGLLTGTVAFVTLILSRVFHASIMSATMPASSAYMADITDASTRTRGMGAVGAANNFGAILGPALGGALAVISLLTPLWSAAALVFLTGLFVLWKLPEAPQAPMSERKSPKLSYLDPRIMPFLVVGVLMFMGFAVVQQTMAFRFQDALGLTAIETARTFGLAMMLSAGASLFSQAILVQVLDLKPFSLLRLAMPLLIGAFALLAFTETRLSMLGGMTLLGLGMGLAGPGFMAGASLAVSNEEQGAVAGVAGSCPPMGFTIGPLLGTFLYSLKPELPYLFTLVVYLPLAIYVMRMRVGR